MGKTSTRRKTNLGSCLKKIKYWGEEQQQQQRRRTSPTWRLTADGQGSARLAGWGLDRGREVRGTGGEEDGKCDGGRRMREEGEEGEVRVQEGEDF